MHLQIKFRDGQMISQQLAIRAQRIVSTTRNVHANIPRPNWLKVWIKNHDDFCDKIARKFDAKRWIAQGRRNILKWFSEMTAEAAPER